VLDLRVMRPKDEDAVLLITGEGPATATAAEET
jgi:hypothetical protein